MEATTVPWEAEGACAAGRYRLHAEVASGGMATIHLGTHAASPTVVAIKRLHPQFARDPEFVAMFLDEARVAERIRHPNVVRVLDVVSEDGEIFLVMEYVIGCSLSLLLRRASAAGAAIPCRIVSRILVDVLHGLHAAHESKSEAGWPLDIVHRDVSPQNVLVGRDGVSRILDFGIAKAVGRLQTSQKGQLKGKLGYMAPEQIHEDPVSGRTDVYAASVVLWEALTGRRLFSGGDDLATLEQVLTARVPPPSASAPWLPGTLDHVVLRGLDRVASNRYDTAGDMARALEGACPPAPPEEVGAYVTSLAREEMAKLERLIATIEDREVRPLVVPPRSPPRRASMFALAALVEIAAIVMGMWFAAGGHAWAR